MSEEEGEWRESTWVFLGATKIKGGKLGHMYMDTEEAKQRLDTWSADTVEACRQLTYAAGIFSKPFGCKRGYDVVGVGYKLDRMDLPDGGTRVRGLGSADWCGDYLRLFPKIRDQLQVWHRALVDMEASKKDMKALAGAPWERLRFFHETYNSAPPSQRHAILTRIITTIVTGKGLK